MNNFLQLAIKTKVEACALFDFYKFKGPPPNSESDEFFFFPENSKNAADELGYVQFFVRQFEEFVTQNTGNNKIEGYLNESFNANDCFFTIVYKGGFGTYFLNNLVENLYRKFKNSNVLILDDVEGMYKLEYFYSKWRSQPFWTGNGSWKDLVDFSEPAA